MTMRLQNLYKRILDASLLVSYILLFVLILVMLYGAVTDVYQFTDPSKPWINEEHYFIRIIMFSVVLLIFIFVLLARVMMQMIQQSSKLLSASKYRKHVSHVKSTQAYQKVTSISSTREYDIIMKKRHEDAIYLDEKLIEEDEDILANQISIDVDTLFDDSEENEVDEDQYYTRLTKKEMVDIIANVLDTSKAKSRRFLDGMLDTIQEELVLRHEVKIDDFGKFSVKEVQEKTIINPLTRDVMTVPQHFEVCFSPFKQFQDDITNDVVATSLRKLLTDTVEREISEDDLSDILEQEERAREHIKTVVVRPMKLKQKNRTKTDILNHINDRTNLSKSKAKIFLNTMTSVIAEELKKGNSVVLNEIGTFTTIEMPAKEAMNPATNDIIVVPAHRQVRLRFSKKMKDKIL